MNLFRLSAAALAYVALSAGSALAVVAPPDVPEPTSLALLASALGVAAVARRRRQQ